jgi:uncharacterized FAD-dependent dehydrogenase
MSRQVQIALAPEEAARMDIVRKAAAGAAKINLSSIHEIRVIKQSVDARQRNIKVIITVDILSESDALQKDTDPYRPQDVSRAKEVLITGAGPAGLFAALRLIELGLRPVIFERGRDVRERKKDIARISREHIVDPDSNYCFGEGGAGTYSDGKLYTRSKKRGDNQRILELLCYFGADRNILYEAHPHIGSDKLPAIISAVRRSIIEAGGQLFLEKKVTDIIIENNSIKGIVVSDNETYFSPELILASGHSSRDIINICVKRGITLEPKFFAMGVRVEHPQEVIDRMQYHGNSRGQFLPSASYNIAKQVDGRGVWSFCMCPGGFIVPSATSQEEVVVNGMSPSGRNSPFANSGIVVEIRPEDLQKYRSYGDTAGLEFQKELEKEAWLNGGQTQRAPAQRLMDFLSGKISSDLPKVSYSPGVVSSEMNSWLPPAIAGRLREGFRLFGSAMKGYLTNEAVILGVESRTSSPIRIPRKADTLEHIHVGGLYPCGEGSGYSGGIVSSAVDGMRAAEAVARKQ